jgi:hypothetical protein
LPPFTLTPEFQLLAACSWVAPAPLLSFQGGQIRQATEHPIDWQAFLDLAVRHRVAALVASNLRRHAPDAIPPEWLALLGEKEVRASRLALQLAGDLARIGRLFSANGIAALPLKGPLLSLRLFGNLAMRDVRDIDILISPADLWRADQLLRAAGYNCICPNFPLTPRMWDAAFRVARHFTYQNSGSRTSMELHWRLPRWMPELVTQLWEQCGRCEWMGVEWKEPAPEHVLLLLCDHGAGHKWSRLKWLSDVATLIAHSPDSVWGPVLGAAGQFDLERPLAQSALLCSSIFSLPLPSPLRSLIDHESAAPTLAAIASRSLFSTAPDRMHSANPLLRLPQLIEELLYYNRKLRKRTPALRELSRLAVCLEDFRGAPIPDELFFLYYLRRPFFWTYRYLRESYRGPAKMTEPKI